MVAGSGPRDRNPLPEGRGKRHEERVAPIDGDLAGGDPLGAGTDDELEDQLLAVERDWAYAGERVRLRRRVHPTVALEDHRAIARPARTHAAPHGDRDERPASWDRHVLRSGATH